MKFFKKSLIVKISTAVLLVEFLALTSLGLFYTDRFSREVDRYLENNVSLPGELMNRQLLRYESVANREVMAEIVGEDFLDGMIIGADGQIYYSLRPELVGKPVAEVAGVNQVLLAEAQVQAKLIWQDDEQESSITAITPLVAYEGAKPFFHVYIKADTMAARANRHRIAGLFIFGSAICMVLTSIAIIWTAQVMITSPLSRLKESADALRRGEHVDIPQGRQDEIGSLAASLAAMRDSIEQKIIELQATNVTLEEREGELSALMDAFPDRIILLDWAGNFLQVHASSSSRFHIDLLELRGKNIHDIHDVELADSALRTIRKTITTGKGQRMEYSLEGPEGTAWLESHTARIGDEEGEAGKVIWVARDITFRKRFESHLTRAKEDAERVNQQLRELDQTKSSLVSSVSHELRTPLTSLLGFSKIILKNFSKHYWPLAKGNEKLLTKGSQIVENLNILIHEGNRLTRLINDVLDLNKIEMGYTEWREEMICPGVLAKQAATAVSGQFVNNPNLELLTDVEDGLPEILLDADRMLQVLLNLLNNAAKFTPSGSVTLRTYKTQDNVIRFEVADTGPGIPKLEKDRIFDVFHQISDVGPADDKPRGAGLGLAICRDIVGHYNGSIWVESEEGKGATFIIELPTT